MIDLSTIDKPHVFDNFLDGDEFDKFNTMRGNKFDWYKEDHSTFAGDGKTRFIHYFYRDMEIIDRDNIGLIWTILRKFNTYNVVFAKANLTIKEDEPDAPQPWHIDCNNVRYDLTLFTAVFYLDTNNGATEFKKNGQLVGSTANRLVVFPHYWEHRVVRHTLGPKDRIVLNLNFM